MSTVSFQARFDSTTSSRVEDQESARAVNVERVRHRMIGVHLVDEADLDLITDSELPVDRRVRRARVPVDELPAHVLDVVRRLTSTMSSSHSMPLRMLVRREPACVSSPGVLGRRSGKHAPARASFRTRGSDLVNRW